MHHEKDVTKQLTGLEVKVNPDTSAREPRAYQLKAEPFAVNVAVQAIGTHVDGHNDEGGQRVESRPAEGGSAVSETAADGSYRGTFSGPLLRGEEGEPRAARIFAAKLRTLGHDVTELPKEQAENNRGEDRKFLIDGNEHVIQIVTMPVDNDLWNKLGRSGTAEIVGPDAVKLMRTSIEKKRNKAKGVVVVLDAAHIGALASRDLVDAYLKAHGDPNQELGFAQTWIVGPTEARTFKIA